MKREPWIALGLSCAAVIGLILWVLFRFVGGDLAALLGALVIGFLPLLTAASYGFWHWEKHPDRGDVEVDEYFHRTILPSIRDYVVPFVFTHTILIGAWIGFCSSQPVVLCILYYAIWLLAGKALEVLPSRFQMLLVVATLVVAAGLGSGLRQLGSLAG